jgi:hypothetical protein
VIVIRKNISAKTQQNVSNGSLPFLVSSKLDEGVLQLEGVE